MQPAAFLIIDDDAAERELMARIAADAFPGVHVHATDDVSSLKDTCLRAEIDCVIVDYNMPGMDGLACTSVLRESFPYLPIVLSTNVGDEMLAAEALQRGVTDYIPKSRITSQSLRRTVEHAMRATKQAQIIDEQHSELENFAYALAHDFKQPIRQIRTFSALLMDAIRDNRIADVEQHLAFLTNAARRLGDLVDVMSEYTLLNQPPAIDDVDLGAVLADVELSLAPYLEERGGALAVGAACAVRGNEALMTQVLQNLVVNGLKYNRSQVPSVRIEMEPTEDHCLIRVADNGIGIEADYLDQIFQPLVRLHANSEYAGSGLGLTLARKAVMAQGGAIWCESEPGSGSTFMVKIPLADAPQALPV